MAKLAKHFFSFYLVFSSCLVSAVDLSKHLADYDSELRRADGRVDADTLVERLSEVGVTTYYWLVWHAPTDWDDLKLFLPKAARAHIQVWVYLVPPTESQPGGYANSEPYGQDYFRWAEEIARLSLQHTNLTAWVIDDFYANHQFFTPAYVREMQARAKQINSKLAFLPLMYFPEINHQFVDAYHEVIDGVVVAYPANRQEIVDARAILNGESLTAPGQLNCPWNTPTHPGDFASATISAVVLPGTVASPADRFHLRFSEQDDFNGPTAGYHFKQVLVDGAVVWEEDVAGGTNGWRDIELDLSPKVRGKTNVALAFRLFDKKGVSNFGVRWRVKALRAEGLLLAAPIEQPRQWRADQRGALEAGFGSAIQAGHAGLHVPFIVMTAAVTNEFQLRHGDPATPERMAEWLRLSLESYQDKQCDGVVTYCLDKGPKSSFFPLARKLFHDFR